ncbi:DUF1653 domain-containing protein [Rickettsiales endosymbiont of Stachyamoeba lipophora]|uniref:DUF1653 domain-containing protein n=1 Tax=Rickettsiales endosymbiont of Stachyamoeba lipophora TaxID=2486578 RepID=UPI000F64D886|nr:DUF1653 domain-containing protein [Rickettsiales endosymbiont of Stachyamoeba lipophora]AZL16250.1 DUF1653 domain-containing protein [Rickettsiales endosymbiont of Stachyamoeba lipophora]
MKLGIYKHYKGNLYRVIGLARHTETLEEMVVYHSLYGDYGIWVRPKVMFEEQIEWHGELQPRFQFTQVLFEQSPLYS